jgi:drug/metabolite transporter (DMT)-like permease
MTRPEHAPRPENPNDRRGIVLALAAASGLGLAVAVSRIAYDGGTNGLTVAMVRGLLMLVGLYIFCRLSGRKVGLSPRDHLHCLGLGVLMAAAFYGNVGSVEFIPVGLSALLFFTFPPMVAVIQMIVVREAIPLPKVAALSIAFTGVATMLGASLSNSDPFGIGLALGAAACVAWSSVWVMRKLRHIDPLVLTFNMASVAAVLLCVVTIGADQVQAPNTPSGWLSLAIVVGLQACSIPLYYAAIPRIGALKSAMVSNVQPLVSILAAFALYQELLSPTQFAGGIAVLGAVIWMQHFDRQHPSRNARLTA